MNFCFSYRSSRRFVPVEPTASLTVLKKRFRRIESVSLTVPPSGMRQSDQSVGLVAAVGGIEPENRRDFVSRAGQPTHTLARRFCRPLVG